MLTWSAIASRKNIRDPFFGQVVYVIALAIPFGISNTPNKTPYFVDKLKVKLVVTGNQIK